MNFYELLMGSVSADQSVASVKSGTRQNGSGKNNSSVSFDQILGSRMTGSSVRTENIRVPAAASTTREPATKGSEASSAPLYKSYRQVQQSLQKTEAQGKAFRSRNTSAEEKAIREDNSTEPDSGKKANISSSKIIQMLAHLMGVDAEKLNKLLAESGISPEALNGLENTAEIAAVMSETLGLDSEKKATLEELLQIIKETAAETSMSQGINETMPSDTIEVKNSDQSAKVSEDTAVIAGNPDAPKNVSDPDIDQLISKISEKLDDFSERLLSEQDDVKGEIEKLLAPMLKKSEDVKQNAVGLNQTAKAGSDELEGIKVPEAEKEQEAGMLKEEDPKETESDDLQMMDGDRKQELPFNPVKQTDGNVQQILAAISSDSQRAAEVGHANAERLTVPAREIISQIVEKAGVVITQDKSEMVMELKPENLGRISLKVVTENGIIMAKFVAENRQVQQVLETNMQVLRDSMEKQGINVQSLSVSVRQDQGQPGENRQQYGNPQRIGNRRSAAGTRAGEGIAAVFAEAPADRNPYLWESNTINLTA